MSADFISQKKLMIYSYDACFVPRQQYTPQEEQWELLNCTDWEHTQGRWEPTQGRVAEKQYKLNHPGKKQTDT